MNTDELNLENVPRLHPPNLEAGPVSAVLDTDAANEIDDQFALSLALLSPERISLEACYAAPFNNPRSSGPEDGMEQSYREIEHILELLGRSSEGFAFRGSTASLASAQEPRPSHAVDDLIERAMAERDGPLYVLAIGAITNVASAILTEPEIASRIVVLWLGGHPHHWPHTREFNLAQDMHAARVIFDAGVALVHTPCLQVAEHLDTSIPELTHHLQNTGPLSDYLLDISRPYFEQGGNLAKPIWDLGPVAWLVNPNWVTTTLTPSPILTDHRTWSHDAHRHLIRVAHHCNRDAIFGDLFRKLTTTDPFASPGVL